MARLPSACLPLPPSPSVVRQLQRRFRAITRGTPGATDTSQLERMLMRLLKTAGLRAVERLIVDTKIPGLVAVTERAFPGRREWTTVDPERGGRLAITVNSNQYYKFKSVSVMWSALPREMTPHEQKVDRIQQAFYARYNAAGERAYATPPRRISATDRQFLLIGEFEADWNNGGFSQYLSNKGRRRATDALRALEHIGAKKTAALLREALSSMNDDAALHKLDDRLHRTSEDLAVLAMKTHA